MLFGQGSNSDSFNPKLWKPVYLRMIRLYWMGETLIDIGTITGYSPTTVSKVVNSDQGQEILTQLQSKTFDSMLEVMNEAQAVAPELIREKIQLALHSSNETIRTKNCTDLLQIAGHVPVQRVVHEADQTDAQFKNKTPAQLKQELLELISPASAAPSSHDSTSSRGPDGNLIN